MQTEAIEQTSGDWMDAKEAGRYLGFSVRTVRTKVKQKKLLFGKSGKEYRFRKQWLDDYIMTGEKK